MLQIKCPWCGLRDQTEYSYGREYGQKRPDDSVEGSPEWVSYVYWRDNHKGEHKEYWHHTSGCRQWLVVTRNTLENVVVGEPVFARSKS